MFAGAAEQPGASSVRWPTCWRSSPDWSALSKRSSARRLQWVVVERFEHARARGGLAARAHLRLRDVPAAGAAGRGGRPARRRLGRLPVGREPRRRSHAGALAHLLGQVAIVDHLDRAEALWRRNGVVATYVTPAGEVLSPTGACAAARGPRPAPSSLLTRKRQLRDLEAEVERLTATVDYQQGGGGDADARRSPPCAPASAASRRRFKRARPSAWRARRISSSRRGSTSACTPARRDDHGGSRAQVTAGDRGDRVAAGPARPARRGGAPMPSRATRRPWRRCARPSRPGAAETETALGSRLTEARSSSRGSRSARRPSGARIARLDEMETDFAARIEQARQRQTLARRAPRLAPWPSAGVRTRPPATWRPSAISARRSPPGRREPSDPGLTRPARRGEPDGAGRGQPAASVAFTRSSRSHRGRVRREELAQDAYRHVRRRDRRAARSSTIPPATWTGAACGDRARGAAGGDRTGQPGGRRGIPRSWTSGSPSSRPDDDLTASIKDLEKALRGMTRTAQDRFAQAFEEINGHFGRIFERLFEGGRAELRLVEAEEGGDPLDTGVELMAQPRGKRLQAGVADVGRERALTGLALLFAIFYFRPSPSACSTRWTPPRRRQYSSVLARTAGADHPDPVPGHHPQPQNDGGGRHPVRCNYGRARLVQLVSVNLAAAVAAAEFPRSVPWRPNRD